MAKDGKRGLTPEQWVEVRAAYEAGDTIVALSERFGVRRQTIQQRRDREAWTVRPTVQMDGDARTVQRRAQAQVIDIGTRRAVEQLESSGVIKVISEAAVDELRATSQASKLAAEYTLEMLRRAVNGEIQPAMSPGEQTEADVARSVLMAYNLFTKTVRENAGIRPGTATVDERPASSGITIKHQRIETVKVAVDERGRKLA